MARVTNLYCDFCGKEMAGADFVTVCAKISSRRIYQLSQTIVDADSLELCPICYADLLGEASRFADYTCNHIRSKKEAVVND